MAKLKNWTITQGFYKEYYLHGIVYGHWDKIRCRNGTYIQTSYVCTVKETAEEIIVHTCNTVFHLKYSDMSHEELVNNTIDFMEEYKLDMAIQALEQLSIDRKQRLQNHIIGISDTLECNCLYFEINPDLNDFAVYKSKTGTNKIEPELIQETMFDFPFYSIKSEEHEFDVRYFYCSNTICFINSIYTILDYNKLADPEDTFLGYISNLGKIPLKIIFSWDKKITIKPNETKKVIYGIGRKYNSNTAIDMYEFIGYD